MILPEYMVYYFHTRLGKYKLLSNASQVGVPALARPSTTFQKIEIEIPDIPSQKRIIAILQTIHDKIAINTKINENLEQQAQALYRQVFVNADDNQSATIADISLNVTDGVHNTVILRRICNQTVKVRYKPPRFRQSSRLLPVRKAMC